MRRASSYAALLLLTHAHALVSTPAVRLGRWRAAACTSMLLGDEPPMKTDGVVGDEPPVKTGAVLAGGALALTAALSVGLAGLLGWDLVGDDTNRGLGRPLSVQENAQLQRADRARADEPAPCGVGDVCRGETLAEEQALLNLYTGVGTRAK